MFCRLWYSCRNSRRASVWLMKSSNVRRENVSGKPAFPRLKFNTTQKEMSENKDRQNYFKTWGGCVYCVVCVRLRNVITQLFSRETSVRKCQMGVYFCLSGVGDDYYAGAADVCAHSKKKSSFFPTAARFSPAVWWRSLPPCSTHSFSMGGHSTERMKRYSVWKGKGLVCFFKETYSLIRLGYGKWK